MFSSVLATGKLLIFLWIFLFWSFHISGIVQYSLLCLDSYFQSVPISQNCFWSTPQIYSCASTTTTRNQFQAIIIYYIILANYIFLRWWVHKHIHLLDYFFIFVYSQSVTLLSKLMRERGGRRERSGGMGRKWTFILLLHLHHELHWPTHQRW